MIRPWESSFIKNGLIFEITPPRATVMILLPCALIYIIERFSARITQLTKYLPIFVSARFADYLVFIARCGTVVRIARILDYCLNYANLPPRSTVMILLPRVMTLLGGLMCLLCSSTMSEASAMNVCSPSKPAWKRNL